MKKFPKTLTTPTRDKAVLDQKRLLLAFKKPTTEQDVRVLIKELNLVPEQEEGKRDQGQPWIQINHTPTRYWVRSADGKTITDLDYSVIQEKLQSKLDWIGPVYSFARQDNRVHKFCPLPHVILIEKSEKLKRRQNTIIKDLKLNEVDEKSKYLSKYRYLTLPNAHSINAFELSAELGDKASALGNIRYENMPMTKPLTATTPNDTLWADQWNMTQVDAPNAWDLSTGANAVVICILDEGCDLTHPDLAFSEDGINLGTMMPTGEPTGNHGTACAGIAAATFNNNEGVSGLAGDCLIMPVAFSAWTDVECANGINYATTNGALVISMSFGVYDGWGWDYTIIDPEIQNAFDQDVVMCVATGNEDDGTTNRYPGRHPLVIAVGASSTDDNRKTTTSPDGEYWWGSNYGEDVYDGVTTGVSVVAPGVLIPTTDRQGGDGYDPTDYVMNFNGTSSATPLVAGFAGLIRSLNPTLTNLEVRNIIERTAAKVGTLAYADQPDFSNGTRNQEMGYGRIDAFQGLDFADVMIKDWSGDDGTEPSSPPSNNWWSYSDIVVRITDDDVFNPSDPAQSKYVERGQTNYIYVRVTNNGPQEARNVVVDFRITPYVGLQFVYPDDWSLEDGMHVRPTPVTANFTSIPSGSSVIAKFTISAAQTDTLYGWQYSNPWHPCLLAVVSSDNDYAFASSDLSFGNLVVRKNNFAQRNLSVIDVLSSATSSTIKSSFVAGHLKNRDQKMKIQIDRTKLPSGVQAFLSLDEDGTAFPEVDFQRPIPGIDDYPSDDCQCDEAMVFTNRTTIKTNFGCCDGILTLEKGSSLQLLCPDKKNEIINIKGGHLVVENGRRYVELTHSLLLVEIEKQPGEILPMAVRLVFPAGLSSGDQYALSVSQKNSNNQTVGGGDYVYQIK